MSLPVAVVLWLFVVWVCWNINALHKRIEALERMKKEE